MIKFNEQVPSIYTNASRDFQYLSWLINIVLNGVKHNIDDMYNLPNTGDPKLTELLALTLGFKVKRSYDQKQLIALVSILPSLLKYKGTRKAVTMAVQSLIMASGVSGDFDSESDMFCKVSNNLLEVTIPQNLIDTTLFMDLLPYILPAGMTCRVNRKTQKQLKPVTKLGFDSSILYADIRSELTYDNTDNMVRGLSQAFEAGKNTPDFTYFTDESKKNYDKDADKDSALLNLSVGLLDNSIIPTIKTPLVDEFSKESRG